MVFGFNVSLNAVQRPAMIFPRFPSNHFRSLLTLCRLVPLPGGGEVGAALAADEGGRHGRGHRVQVQDPVDAFLQAGQVDELRVCRVRDEMHFRRGRLWRWDLEESKIDELISLLARDDNDLIKT